MIFHNITDKGTPILLMSYDHNSTLHINMVINNLFIHQYTLIKPIFNTKLHVPYDDSPTPIKLDQNKSTLSHLIWKYFEDRKVSNDVRKPTILIDTIACARVERYCGGRNIIRKTSHHDWEQNENQNSTHLEWAISHRHATSMIFNQENPIRFWTSK